MRGHGAGHQAAAVKVDESRSSWVRREGQIGREGLAGKEGV